MANTYDSGDRIRASVVFGDLDGAVADPTAVVAKYKNPAGTITTKTYGSDAEVVKVSTGRYYIDIDLDAEGTWYYRFAGTGDVVAAGEESVVVRATQF